MALYDGRQPSCFATAPSRAYDYGDVPEDYLSRLSPLEQALNSVVEQGGPPAPCALLVPKGYTLKEGSELWGGIKLGRMLGAGVQARVFELVHEDGTPAGKVLKIGHTDLGHKLVNSIFIGMEREWEIGMELRAGLEEPGGLLPGFVRVCDCVVQAEQQGLSGNAKARFNGMIMEKINGWELHKRVDTPEFCNIHYIREALFQVFSALDRAQRRMGFHHADLGMRNVMEHYPVLWAELEEEERSQSMHAAGMAAGSGGGHSSGTGAEQGHASNLEPAGPSVAAEPQQPQQEQPAADAAPPPYCAPCEAATAAAAQRPWAASQPQPAGASRPACAPCAAAAGEPLEGDAPCRPCQQMSNESQQSTLSQPRWRFRPVGPTCPRIPPRPGYSCTAGGKLLPLGPQIEFKIIDYGTAVFNDTLAQAAGGYEAQETMARIQRLFAAQKEVTRSQIRRGEFTSDKRQGRIDLEMVTSEEAAKLPGMPKRRKWHLLPSGIPNRFKVKQTAGDAVPLPSGELPEVSATPPGSPERMSMEASTHSTSNGSRTPSHSLGRPPSGRTAPPKSPRAKPSAKPSSSTPRMGPVERLYRQFWQRKGDVYHLLMSLALVLDDRVWPKQDQREVNMFISLVHHVTGIRLKASFANPDEVAVRCFGLSQMQRQYGRRASWARWLRSMHITFWGHVHPYNSGITAGEALVAPFFGAGRVQHAKLPVCTAAAFPASVKSSG